MIYRITATLAIVALFAACERLTDFEDHDDGLPPGVPQGVRVEYASDGEALISWKKNVEIDFARYVVYRAAFDVSNFREVARTTNTYYYDDSLAYWNDYYYRVAAMDDEGRISEPSETVIVKPENNRSPLTPLFPEAYGRNWEGKVSIYLEWYSRSESDVARHDVYRGTESDFPLDSTTFVGSATASWFEDSANVELSQTYYYRIVAVDRDGLTSGPTPVVSDKALPAPEPIFPPDRSAVEFFESFAFTSVGEPAGYRVAIYETPYGEPVWKDAFKSDATTDTVRARLGGAYLAYHSNYYWRVSSFTKSPERPNGVSSFRQFTVVESY
jgi:hypothetical protein